MEKEQSKSAKLEQAMKVLFGGYFKKEEQLREQFESKIKEYKKLEIEEEVFKVLEG